MESERPVGNLTVILSMMYGGKTTSLLRILEITSYAVPPLYVNHVIDTRSEGGFSTHNPLIDQGVPQDRITMVKVERLGDLPDELVKRHQVVCVDEGQFFADLPEVVVRWVEELGIDVHVASLSGDYKRKNFGRVHELIPLANDVRVLRDTLCAACAKKGKRSIALFTHRINDASGRQIEVGATNYIPVCRPCYCALNLRSDHGGS